MSSRILIIEDDPDTVKLVSLYLSRDGHEVLTARDGVEGLRLARESAPSLIVLDLMLPRLDGIQVCRAVREESDVPIVMVTARVAEADRLAGLDLGADDYITKPFSPRELAARVRAVLRRTARGGAENDAPNLSYGQVVVDPATRAARVGSTQISLTPTEFRLLAMFLRQPGRVFTREQIIDEVFGYDFDGFDRTVDAHVANLRRKVEPNPRQPQYLHTVYGVGYKFGDA